MFGKFSDFYFITPET